MNSFLLLLYISLFGSALAGTQCTVNNVCCNCPSSTSCNQFSVNPSSGICDDISLYQTCPSSSSASQYASLAGTYKTSNAVCSFPFWADGYSFTPLGTNSYILISSYNRVEGNIIQASNSTF